MFYRYDIAGFSEQMWRSLSSVYGKLLVLLVLTFYLYVNDENSSISIFQFQVYIIINLIINYKLFYIQ